MKTRSWIVLMAGAASAFSALAADPIIGDSRAKVVECLGEPSGKVLMPGKEWLSYPRGTVVLTDGAVSRLELISQQELDSRQAAAQARAEREKAEAEALRERRLREGAELLARIRTDAAFAASSATDRLAYWRQFSSRYPEVDVSLETSRALADWRVERNRLEAQAAEERRLAELERRVADAEARAARAEQEARENRRRPLYYHPYSSGYITRADSPLYSSVCPTPPVVFQIDGPVPRGGFSKATVETQYRPIWVSPSINDRHRTTVEVDYPGVKGKISL